MESFEDKRAHFRVDLIRPVKGTAELISINGQQSPLKKSLLLSILDLSAGGMRVETELDLPTKLRIVLKVAFELENEPFVISCELIRKRNAGEKKDYGIKFYSISRRDEQRLVRSLNHYKIRQSKPQSPEAKRLYLVGIESLLKTLEALPGPAFLINSYRVILGANTKAQGLGIRLGERCHLIVGRAKKKCRNCMLEEAWGSSEILAANIDMMNSKYRAHWLNLEQGLCLHYFIPQEVFSTCIED